MGSTAVPKSHRRGLRSGAALASTVTLTAMTAAVATGSPPAQAALRSHRPGALPDATSSSSLLNGVSAASASDAWAAGDYQASRTTPNAPLTLHWNGTAWKMVQNPVPSGASVSGLQAVSAASSTDAWAVGTYEKSANPNDALPLTLHWNGTAWKQVKSPVPSGSATTELNGVSAVSATNAWAVGYDYDSSGVYKPVILHWNGTAWKQVASPAPSGGQSPELFAVSADSATDAWAAGSYKSSAGASLPLIMHWNGTAWKAVPSPAVPSGSDLKAVSAVSASDAWAAGTYPSTSGAYVPLLLHWNGTAWKLVKGPAPSGATFTELNGVSAVSASSAWAAGLDTNSSGVIKPLLLHWNGTAWSQVASPAPSGSTVTILFGVSAVSASDAWAAGYYTTSSNATESLLLHWNGTAWKVVTTPNGT